MLERLDSYRGLTLHALDGELGRVGDFRFDEERWVIRYLVVGTRAWLGRHVLISPVFVEEPDWVDGTLKVRLTSDQIKNSPEVPPVEAFDRDTETRVANYYGIPTYWIGPQIWGRAGTPGLLRDAEPPTGDEATTEGKQLRDAKLRSLHSLRGLHLHARDGEIGHVDDAFIDQETWRMEHLLVDTSNWIGGTYVMVPTALVCQIDWIEQRLTVDATTGHIRSAPEYDAERSVDQTVEDALARHYGLAADGRPIPGRAASRGARR